MESERSNNKNNLQGLTMQYEAAARKLEEETARALKEFKQNKLEHEVKHAEELLQARGLSGIKLASDEHHEGEVTCVFHSSIFSFCVCV